MENDKKQLLEKLDQNLSKSKDMLDKLQKDLIINVQDEQELVSLNNLLEEANAKLKDLKYRDNEEE